MKKKIFSYLLIGAMALSLVACSGKAEAIKDNGTAQEEQLEDVKDTGDTEESAETDKSEESAEPADVKNEETESGTETTKDKETKDKEIKDKETNDKEAESKEEKDDSKSESISDKVSNTAEKPAAGRPVTSGEKSPASSKPNTTKPSTTKPSNTKPSNTKPSNTKPSTGKPDTSKPDKDKPVKKVTLSSIHNVVKKAYGDDYIPSMAYDATALEEQFGIKLDWYTDIIAEGPMMSMNVDTFVAVQANKNNVNDVVDALEQYRDRLINETLQYPMNLPKINASQVLKIDNNVFFIMLGVIPDDTEETEEALLKAAKTQNEIAVKAIKKAMNK